MQLDYIALATLAVAMAALVVAVIAWWRSDRNTSAGTLVTLYESFRQGWQRFLDAEPDTKDYEFAELVNVFEVACAIHYDRAVHGATKEVLEDYLFDTLTLIKQNEDVRARMTALRDRPKTFKYLVKFLVAMRRKGRPHEIEGVIAPGPLTGADT